MGDAPKKFRDDKNPSVTAEVGGEGGSFADATFRRPDDARDEDLPRQDDTRQPNAAAEVAQNATHRESIAEGGVGTEPGPDTGMKKYPTE